jgi:hypothetical protein
MSMQGQPDTIASPSKTQPRVAIEFEHPPELMTHMRDQVDTLEIEISEWEERLWRLRTCRDAILQSARYLEEVVNQAQTTPDYHR